MLCTLFRRDTIADQVDLRFNFRESMKGSGERRGAKQMVRVIVGDVEARERLAENADVIDNLARVAQRILRVDGDDLRRQLDKMRIDAPTLVRRSIGVNANAVALCHSHLAEHAHSLSLGRCF
jgi:hypothetical protein